MDVSVKIFFFRDEGLHTDFACLMFRHLVNKPTKERILEVEFFIYFINFFDDQDDQVLSIIHLTRATRRLCAML